MTGLETEIGDGDRRGRLLFGLRVYGALYTELTRRFAAHLGLHATDAAALTEILYAEDQGTPTTPARLAARIGLTSGATTTLINRLERDGHVVRSREHLDRRIVTLYSGSQAREPAMAFFAPLGASLDAMLARYPPEILDDVEGFLDDLRATMEGVLDQEPGSPGSTMAR